MFLVLHLLWGWEADREVRGCNMYLHSVNTGTFTTHRKESAPFPSPIRTSITKGRVLGERKKVQMSSAGWLLVLRLKSPSGLWVGLEKSSP